MIKLNKDLIDDVKLSVIVMIIAGCGFIYQYLLASYSARIIGVMEVVIFTIMTIMVLFMGIGSFIVKRFKDKFFCFSILESLIGIVAISSIFVISGTNAISNTLPDILSDTFGVPVEVFMQYGWVSNAQSVLNSSSYVMAALLGLLLGMEIPFLASIREEIHKTKKLQNNIGVIYGVDYIGGAIGAFLWIYYLMQFDIKFSVQVVTITNVIVGFFFILMFKSNIKRFKTALAFQIFTGLFIFIACSFINNWSYLIQNSLYKDNVVYSENTPYQNFVVTKGHNKVNNEDRYSLFINGHTQFSDADEGIYHSLLTYPALISAGLPDDILIIGGGDGLATRDILRSNPKSVTLLDLDPRLVEFFTKPTYDKEGNQVNKDFLKMTEGSFKDERVNFMFGDAYLNVKKLMVQGRKFGAIIVDLPDPSHPDLNKLYSKEFYEELYTILKDNGAISIQSGAPYSAKKAFISIGKTLKASGFYVQQYKHIVPSFAGMWGWTIGTKSLPYPKERLASLDGMPIEDEWLTQSLMLSTFEFGKNYYKDVDNIKVNTIDNNATYLYYSKAWEELSRSAFE